jgi:hypothetical protein
MTLSGYVPGQGSLASSDVVRHLVVELLSLHADRCLFGFGHLKPTVDSFNVISRDAAYSGSLLPSIYTCS